MIVSPRKLRNCTDTLGLILGAATMACALSAVGIAGYWERIMSGYSKQLICGIALGATTLAYHLSSLAVTAAKPSSRFTSLLTSTLLRELLLGLGAALAGYQSDVFVGVNECNDFRSRWLGYGDAHEAGPAANCRLPLAAGVLAWVTVAVNALGIGLEMVVITKRYGNTKETWWASIASLTAIDEREVMEATRALNPWRASAAVEQSKWDMA